MRNSECGMRNCKTRGYADHTPELSVHVYGFSSTAVRDELAEEIKEVIRRFDRNHPDEVFQRKITLD